MNSELTEHQCRKCGEVKPLASFHRNHQNRSGHEGRCKPCSVKYNRERRAKLSPNGPIQVELLQLLLGRTGKVRSVLLNPKLIDKAVQEGVVHVEDGLADLTDQGLAKFAALRAVKCDGRTWPR